MSIPLGLLDALKVRYAEPHRHYHTWAHIESLLTHFCRWESHFHRPEPVLWALYWHDAIYDPRAPDNEERSAQLLEQEVIGHLPPVDIAFAAQIIRATAGHRVPEGLSGPDADDLALFLDLDLSSFAASESDFAQKQHNIRAEYDFVPDDRFRTARKAILTDFLGRERLYLTDLAHAEWDQKARANLARSISGLELAWRRRENRDGSGRCQVRFCYLDAGAPHGLAERGLQDGDIGIICSRECRGCHVGMGLAGWQGQQEQAREHIAQKRTRGHRPVLHFVRGMLMSRLVSESGCPGNSSGGPSAVVALFTETLWVD